MTTCTSPVARFSALIVLVIAPGCGLSYEPDTGLQGATAEDIGRNMIEGNPSGQLQCAIAAVPDGWVVRHGRSVGVYDNELYVPEGKSVVLQLTGGSEDVSLEIPQFGVRKYLESGKSKKVWIKPRSMGKYVMRYKPVRGGADRVIEGQVNVITLDEWKEMFE